MTTGAQDAYLCFESCTGSWVFDTARMRYRRILNGYPRRATTPWQPYYGLEVEGGSESFTVLLSPDGTRRLHSWRHLGPCPECGGIASGTRSADELRGALVG